MEFKISLECIPSTPPPPPATKRLVFFPRRKALCNALIPPLCSPVLLRLANSPVDIVPLSSSLPRGLCCSVPQKAVPLRRVFVCKTRRLLTGDVAQLLDCLPSIPEAGRSISSLQKLGVVGSTVVCTHRREVQGRFRLHRKLSQPGI